MQRSHKFKHFELAKRGMRMAFGVGKVVIRSQFGSTANDLIRQDQTVKDEPQPQVVVALGLMTRKRDPSNPSV